MGSERERFESAWWEVCDDEGDSEPYWHGGGSGDKEASRFDCGEPLTMDPRHFPVGTRIEISEPEDPEFYERLWANNRVVDERDTPPEISSPIPPPDDLRAELVKELRKMVSMWDAPTTWAEKDRRLASARAVLAKVDALAAGGVGAR